MNFDVIAALATAPAPAGIAVIRVSGPRAGKVIPQVFHSKEDPTSKPREMIFGTAINCCNQVKLDKGLLVFFPELQSYTGEESFELHLHGSMGVVRSVFESIYSAGARPAEPGEFTKRAFINGKLDLIQAEAVHDLIVGSSEAAHKIALEQLSGRLSTAVSELGEPLRDLLAEIEAGVDFPEEGIEPETLDRLQNVVADSISQIQRFINSYSYGEAVKEGFRVLLCGPPNAGKSSLLNALLATKRAIVTDVAGTTRDLIEERATIREHAFVFCDSAGITNSRDTVEQIGVELARERISWADLVLMIVDGSSSEIEPCLEILAEIEKKGAIAWVIVNKCDLGISEQVTKALSSLAQPSLHISAFKGDGIDQLKENLSGEIEKRLPVNMERSIVVTNARHRACLMRAKEALTKTGEAINNALPAEIVSAELRIALSALEEIVGKTWSEDILGRIFSKFCVGK